jgi:nitrogen fixation/metabolism regulation signal transduction histidine kinase
LFRTFTFGFVWRIAALCACFAAMGLFARTEWMFLGMGAAAFLAFNLFRYVNDTNRRLTRFFESIRYSDFAIRFSSVKEKGDSFESVNRQFNEVMEAFRQTRAEKEANLLFMNAMVQHLTTGVLAFDMQQNLLLSNNAALQLLGIYRIQYLSDLPAKHEPLSAFISDLNARGKILYQPDASRQLAVQGVNLNLQGRKVRLLTLQNIQSELQGKEVDAWRNLTRVLRHEIMNSVTPIVSIVETMQDIIKYDLPADANGVADLTEALEVVAARSKGLVNFVEAYRSFSAIPRPRLEEIQVKKLIDRVVQLSMADTKGSSVKIETSVEPENLVLQADPSQIEMVLINLVKNAREALDGQPDTLNRAYFRIALRAAMDDKQRVAILVEDNGPGISFELLEEIFIPFFTTKPTGTGVGLSISRQIMQLHDGEISVSSTPGSGTQFKLLF